MTRRRTRDRSTSRSSPAVTTARWCPTNSRTSDPALRGYGPFKVTSSRGDKRRKTTYLVDVLNAIFGAENISNVSLQRIGTDRIVGGDIEKAAINRCDDLSDVPLENVGPFKALTGGFSHNIERKFKTPYRGRITAVHAFSTNMPPTVPDNILFDPAFWSRWIYLRFNNVFEVDPSFVPRTLTPENVSGAFNRILETAFEMRHRQTPREQDPERCGRPGRVQRTHLRSL